MNRFQVLFSGEIAQGASETAVRQNLMRRLGLDERKVGQLFSGRTVVVRSDLNRDAADALQAELAELGAIARIKNLAPDDKAKFKVDRQPDQTLKDITAAHIECPRCGHLQLESEFCARCGVDIAAAGKQKRKEDLLIEKRIRDLKEQKHASPEPAADVYAEERLEPIKRRTQRPRIPQRSETTSRPRPRTASQSDAVPRPGRPGRGSTPSSRTNDRDDDTGSFWRNMLKLGRKDERSP